jgi:glycosyltransferase involved in cell wall biosynthesis
MKTQEGRIAVVSNYGVGGSSLYLRQFAAAMKKNGFPVTYYVPKGTDMGVADDASCRYALREPSTHPPFVKAKILKYAYHLAKYLYNAAVFRPGGEVRVVHMLFPFYLTDFLVANRLKREGKKVVLTVHEVLPHRPFLGGRADRGMMKKLYERADLLLAHTRSLKKELVELFSLSPDKISVVPHGYFALPQSPLGVAALREKYHIPQGRKVLLFFGSIRENKGLDVLIDAMKGLTRDYFLVIAGETAGASEIPARHYRDLIARYRIADSVVWTEKYIPEEEAAEFFKMADAVVLPYKGSFHAQSGILNLAAGFDRPCVVSDVGGLGELVHEYRLGVVVPPEDADALREGIITLFENRNSASYGFQEYSDENNWDRAAEKYVEIYRRLLSE